MSRRPSPTNFPESSALFLFPKLAMKSSKRPTVVSSVSSAELDQVRGKKQTDNKISSFRKTSGSVSLRHPPGPSLAIQSRGSCSLLSFTLHRVVSPAQRVGNAGLTCGPSLSEIPSLLNLAECTGLVIPAYRAVIFCYPVAQAL